LEEHRLNPASHAVLIQLAYCYIGLGSYKQAEKIYSDLSANSDSNMEECFYGLGMIYENNKRYEEALDCYEKAVNLANAAWYNWAAENVRKKYKGRFK